MSKSRFKPGDCVRASSVLLAVRQGVAFGYDAGDGIGKVVRCSINGVVYVQPHDGGSIFHFLAGELEFDVERSLVEAARQQRIRLMGQKKKKTPQRRKRRFGRINTRSTAMLSERDQAALWRMVGEKPDRA